MLKENSVSETDLFQDESTMYQVPLFEPSDKALNTVKDQVPSHKTDVL